MLADVQSFMWRWDREVAKGAILNNDLIQRIRADMDYGKTTPNAPPAAMPSPVLPSFDYRVHRSLDDILIDGGSAVARVITPYCIGTEFLVGCDLFLTNRHLIPTQQIAYQSRVEFNYDMPRPGEYP